MMSSSFVKLNLDETVLVLHRAMKNRRMKWRQKKTLLKRKRTLMESFLVLKHIKNDWKTLYKLNEIRLLLEAFRWFIVNRLLFSSWQAILLWFQSQESWQFHFEDAAMGKLHIRQLRRKSSPRKPKHSTVEKLALYWNLKALSVEIVDEIRSRIVWIWH